MYPTVIMNTDTGFLTSVHNSTGRRSIQFIDGVVSGRNLYASLDVLSVSPPAFRSLFHAIVVALSIQTVS